MIKRLVFLLAIVLLAACREAAPESDMTPEEQASLTARNMYQALYRGDYDTFLDNRLQAGDMPDSYRKAMLTNLKQHVAKTRDAHQGVDRIEVSHTVKDSTLQVVQVFLILNYNDSVREQIVVPMVESDGEWKLK